MEQIKIVGIIIIIACCLLSYRGLSSTSFFNAYKFHVDSILISKDYKRLITSGFLHVSWWHLFFNMYSLYVFSATLNVFMPLYQYLLIYFLSLIGASLLALYIHRNHGDYSAVGASGAISGIVFAAIALVPSMELVFFGLRFPAWLYAVLFIAISIYGIRNQKDNIAHEAHLGGAITGVLVLLTLQPSLISTNYFIIALILIPCIVFLIIIIRKPSIMIKAFSFNYQNTENLTVDDKFNLERKNKEEELDKLLDKIAQKGVKSLSADEKRRLEMLSK